jgi:hypothetical protein
VTVSGKADVGGGGHLLLDVPRADTGGGPFSKFFYDVELDVVRPRQHLCDDSHPTDVAAAGDGDSIAHGDTFGCAKHEWFCGDSDREVSVKGKVLIFEIPKLISCMCII